jgi:sec-independent protein translocase protein TatA
MPQIGPAEIVVILLVGMLVFGPKRLPEMGKQVGRAMREVKKFQEVVRGELDAVVHLHEAENVRAPASVTATAPGTGEAVPAPSRFRVPSLPR